MCHKTVSSYPGPMQTFLINYSFLFLFFLLNMDVASQCVAPESLSIDHLVFEINLILA